MNINEYIESKSTVKPNQDIIGRWQSRIVGRGLQFHGLEGAAQYLADYGKGIQAPKLVMLARQAELTGFPQLAMGFWAKAFELETGQRVDPQTLKLSDDVPTPQVGLIPEFHERLQPGVLEPMQPSDAKHARSYYINNPAYWGMPKRDGEKLIVFAGGQSVFYQTRSMRIRQAPSIQFDRAIHIAKERFGSFIIEGEIYFLDIKGNEHQDGARAAAANIEDGQPEVRPVMRFSAFDCLYLNQQGNHIHTKERRVELANWLMRKLERIAPEIFVEMPLATTKEAKQELCDKQQAEGREGEIFFLPDRPYSPGKVLDESFVRCKYLTEPTEYIITNVYRSPRPEQTISGFDVSTLDGKPLGKVGTGYTHAKQDEILQAHLANPGKVKVVCVSRGFTVKGKLREARFIQLVETGQEAPEGEF